MSRIDVKKVVPLFLIPMLVLATTGIAYAMWSETLKINVTINTGDVAVEWSSWDCNDKGIDPGYDKDVGQCFVDSEVVDEHGNVIKLNITLNNTYPSYNVTVSGEVDNIGSIPVEPYWFFIDMNGNGVYDSGEDTNITLCTDYELNLDTDGKADVDFHVYLKTDGGNDGTQIDPGESDTYGFIIHVKQNATECTTYTFHVVLVFAQWNEV